jgi:nucleoid-associated protein YgaU
MRTDAKIGFAIGGVLLAVLAAYLIVIGPKHNGKKKTVALVPTAQVTPAPTAEDPITPAAAPNRIPSPTPPMASANDSGSTPTPALPATPTSPDQTSKLALPDDHSRVAQANAKLFHPSVPDKSVDAGDSMTDGVPDGMIVQNTNPVSSDPTPRSVKSRLHRLLIRHGGDHAITADHTADHSADHLGATTDRQYSVKSGQTLSSIAADVYGNARFWVAIQRENPGLDAKHLKVGQKINMPDISDVRPNGPVLVDVLEPVTTTSGTDIDGNARTYRVLSGDSLYKISKKVFGTGKHASAIYDMNKDLIGDDESKLKLGMVLNLPEIANRPAVVQ